MFRTVVIAGGGDVDITIYGGLDGLEFEAGGGESLPLPTPALVPTQSPYLFLLLPVRRRPRNVSARSDGIRTR
jgi:hypothetical protein